MTVAAPNFAGKLVLDGLLSRVVPLEIVMAMREVDVVLLENRSPLKWSSMLRLTSRAMAQLAIQWLFPAQLILDLATMAAGVVQRVEPIVVLVNSVWGTLLPVLHLSLGLLILVLVDTGVVGLAHGRGDWSCEVEDRSRGFGEDGSWLEYRS